MAFVLFCAVAAVTPGPSNIMLTAAGAQVGIVRGLPCLLGVTTGMGLMMFVVLFGLGSVVLEHPLVLVALNWLGAAFLLWLSWKIATSPAPTEGVPRRGPIGYVGAAIFQWVSPKSWLVAASSASTFLSAEAGSPIGQAISLAGLFVLVALPSCFLWLAFGAVVQRVLHTPRRSRIFNATMGVLLAFSLVLLLW